MATEAEAKIEDGGPAFPHEGGDFSGLYAEPGMSIRDYFAGQAMTGLYAGRGGQAIQEQHFGEDARLAYAAADAMIKARKAGA